jgi:hypothetical protein
MTQTGMSPEFEAYVVSRAAELVQGGVPMSEAIVAAMRTTILWYAELTLGETERAKAFRAEVTRRIFAALRVEVGE